MSDLTAARALAAEARRRGTFVFSKQVFAMADTIEALAGGVERLREENGGLRAALTTVAEKVCDWLEPEARKLATNEGT